MPVEKKGAKKAVKKTVKLKVSSVEVRLCLPALLDISTSEVFAGELAGFLKKKSKKYIFNAAKVEKITTPGVQLLLAVSNEIKKNKAKCMVEEPTELFVEALNDLGLFEQLKEWKVSNG